MWSHPAGTVRRQLPYTTSQQRSTLQPRALSVITGTDDGGRSPGTLYRSGKDNNQTRTVYSAYAGGPLIEDKLFIFVAGETDKTDGVTTNARTNSIQGQNNYGYSSPKFYGKLDWNINDSNILEYTRIQNTDRRGGYYTAFNYDDLSTGGATGTFPDTFKITDKYDIFKYTGYLTDDLTLNATWGRSTQHNRQFNPNISTFHFSTASPSKIRQLWVTRRFATARRPIEPRLMIRSASHGVFV